MSNPYIRLIFWGLLAVSCAVVGLHGFLIPLGFIDGGVVGISMLIAKSTNTGLSVWIAVVSAPFLLMGAKVNSIRFAVFSGLTVTVLALALAFTPVFYVTDQPILGAIFGGVLLGTGIGLAMRGGAVLDGTEILALFVSKKYGFSVGELILVINLIIFGAAAFLLSVEQALYSILTYLSASRAVDYILHGLEQYTGITIVSPHSKEIREAIVHQTNRGVTIYNAKGGFSEKPMDVLYCVVTRLEIYRIKRIIHQYDADAFIITNSLNEASGGLLRRTPASHI